MLNYSSGKLPWTDVGTPVDDAPTSAQAIKIAGLDWDVRTGPLWVLDAERRATKLAAYRAVHRMDTMQVLGIVTSAYEPISNADVFTVLDECVKDGTMRYETAGDLYGGKTVWMLGRMQEDWRINGDEWHQYLLGSTRHDGGGGLHVKPVMTRVVCANTLAMALAERTITMRVVHTGDVERKLDEVRRVLAISTEASRRAAAFLERAASVKPTKRQITTVQEAIIGSLDEDDERRKAALEKFLGIYDEEKEVVGSNAYALVNAVTGYADHIIAPRMRSDERRFAVLTGERRGEAGRVKSTGLAVLEDIVGEHFQFQAA